MKSDEKLRVYYSKKEDDLIFYHPLGRRTSADGWFLNGIFDKKFVEEIKRRGYDITTLKFEISPKLPNFNKFETLSKRHGYVDSKE